MAITNFPNGVSSFGAPVMNNKYAGWWGNKVWYVDDISGADGYDGKTPTRAKATIQGAIDVAGSQDTIFVRPRDVTVGDYNSHGYITNLVSNIATGEAMQGLSIIGTHSGADYGANSQCAIAPVAGITPATILVESPCVTIENFLIKTVAGQTGGGIGAVDSTARSWGLTVSNCSFKNFATYLTSNLLACIHLDNNHWTTIQHCRFRKAFVGINCGSSGGVIEGLSVTDCDFDGAAAYWDADIYMGDVKHIRIHNCRFNHALPAWVTGEKLFYIYMGGSAGSGMVSDCYFSADTAAAATLMTLVGTVLPVHCYGKPSLLDT